MTLSILVKQKYFFEKLITVVWFGLLSYFFISAQNVFFPHLISAVPLFKWSLIFLPVLAMVIGFCWGYKTLLLSAEQLPHFSLRCVSGIWTGSASYLLIIGLNINSLSALLTISIPGFLLGFLLVYRIFLYPTVSYSNPFPTLIQRIIAALYFGLAGYCVFRWVEMDKYEHLRDFAEFVFLLSAYMGFYYGYRVLLLPSSVRGFLKSIMLGILGSSYILFISLLIFSFGFVIISVNQPKYFSLTDLLGVNFALMFVFLRLAGCFISFVGAVFSLVFYLISRIWAE